MPQHKVRAQREGDQEYKGNGRQSLIGDLHALARSVPVFGTAAASMEEAMLERPVFGEIHPAIVFLLPAVVSEAADERSGKGRSGQGGDPKPFMVGRVGGRYSFPIAVSRQHLLGAEHPHRLGVVAVNGSPSVSQSWTLYVLWSRGSEKVKSGGR